jgi:hypothetical protein
MNEFKLWVDPLANNIVVHNFHILQPALRVYMITEWHHKGGVLLIGDRAFANISKEKQTKRNKVLSEVCLLCISRIIVSVHVKLVLTILCSL